MKARKAVIIGLVGMLAGPVSLFPAARLKKVSAEERNADVILTAEYAAADTDGNFTAGLFLDALPETGLSALDFAISYDPSLLHVEEVVLLYDTGAQAAETLADPRLADSVFTCTFAPEDKTDAKTGKQTEAGEIRIRWVTALEDPEYWLRETRPFFELHGTLSDKLKGGTAAALTVTAPKLTADAQTGSQKEKSVIKAGYLDREGEVFSCSVEVRDGLVWKPRDKTGATVDGDVDLDGQCSIADTVLASRALAEEIALSAAAYANADCVKDGIFTIADVALMLQALPGSRDQEAGAH